MEAIVLKFYLLPDAQFGFRENHNTELAIINSINFIINLIDAYTPVSGLYRVV